MIPSPFRTKAVLAVAAVTACLWSAIAAVLYQARTDALESAATTGTGIARVLAEAQASSLRAIDTTLRHLRAEWQRDPRWMKSAVAREEENLKGERLIQVAIVDAEGWTIYSRLPLAKPINFADRAYFQAQKASGRDEMVISEAVMGRVTKQWAIQFSRPIFDRQGRFAGIIVVALPPPALETVYQELRLGEDDVVTLVRSDGVILARSRALDRASQVSIGGVPGLAPADPSSGAFRGGARVDGIERLVSYAKVPGYPLTMYVGHALSAVLAPYERLKQLLLAGGAIATLMLVLLARLAASRRRLRDELRSGEQRAAEERERLMLELHDGSIQSIYAIGMSLESARRQLERDPKAAEGAIAEAVARLNLVIQDLRNFIAGKSRAPRSEAEFMHEIERLLPAAPPFSVDVDRGVVSGLSGEQATHVLRIAREGVSNVVRHARAGKAHLSLSRGASGGVRLEISDNGVGIAGERRGGLGLHHIGARGEKLAGTTRVESAPGRGTRIVVEFPG